MSLKGLIALKAICCGGLLVATGTLSLGSLAALAGSPALRLAGGVAVLLALAAIGRRMAARLSWRRVTPADGRVRGTG